VAESAVNTTDVVPQDCCYCIARARYCDRFLIGAQESDKHSAELAISSRSSGGPTMVVLEHSTKPFTAVDGPVL
jgi:hypothetical protein